MGELLALLAPAAISFGSNLLSGNDQADYQKKMEAEKKKADRRAAIERAMGGNALGRNVQAPQAPDLSTYNTINALAGLGGQIAGRF